MAKTRLQAQRERQSSSIVTKFSPKKLSKNLKRTKTTHQNQKIIKVSHQMIECRVRLTKLSPTQINFWLNGQPAKQEKDCEKKTYELRKRIPTANCVSMTKPIEKSLKQLAVASQNALCTAKAIRIWESIKKQIAKNIIQLEINQIVCARMSGHRPWPAKVIAIQKNGIKLFFFGTNETGIVKKIDVISYEKCGDVLEQYLKVSISDVANNRLCYHLSFIKACKEVSC